MAVGDTVIKYGVDIGKVVQPITQGRARARPQHQDQAVVAMNKTFQGYRRENGRVGVRNHVIILPVDDLSNAAAEAVANNVKGTLAIPHPYGRLQFGADLDLHFRTLIGAGSNPNVAAVVVIGIEEQWTKKRRRRHRGHRQAGAGLRHRAARRSRHDHARVEGRARNTCSGRASARAANARCPSCGCRPSAANPTRRRAAAPIPRSATRSTSSTRPAARWCSARPPS